MATYTWDFGAAGSGLHFTIDFDLSTNKFKVTSHEGQFDLNALWWGDETADGAQPVLAKGDSSLNMNGDSTVWGDDGNSTSEKIDWDGYQKLSDTGLGKAGESKSTFISQGETTEFDAGAGFQAFLAGLQPGEDFALGVRATSVNGGGSIKFADTDPKYTPDAPTQDDFPEFPQDISNIVLYFLQDEGDIRPINGKTDGGGQAYPSNPSDPQDGDGYYLVKIDHVPTGADDDLDNWIEQALAYLVANDPNVDADSDLLGVAIKGGLQPTQFYAYGANNGNGTAADPFPVGAPIADGGGGNVPGTSIDQSYDYNVLNIV